MATDLEKALTKAKYAALPLPRASSGPTTVFAFTDGHLYIVRNPHTCLPDPPISITPDPAVDTITFSRTFSFEISGLIGFFTKLLGIGSAKAEFDAKGISSATVQMGQLVHQTLETGGMIEYLLQQKPSLCMHDLFDKDHFTVVAALQAGSFTYTFKNSKGATVKVSLPEATTLFHADVDAKIEVTQEGQVVVNAPRYVGVVTWDGKKIEREVAKARKYTQGRGLQPYRAPAALANALEPAELYGRRLASMGGKAGTTMALAKAAGKR